jgi:hypothetical protein
MKTRAKVQANSKYQYTKRWWAEQVVQWAIAIALCLMASLEF